MTQEEELRALRARIAVLEADNDRMLPIYTAHLVEVERVAERLERERLRVAALTERELHCEQRHPDYEYLTTENARKQSGGEPPENKGWGPNDIVECHLYKDGVVLEERWRNWTRGEYTETNYWRRKIAHELVLECLWPAAVGEQIQLTTRFSEDHMFLPERFVIQDAGDWCVHDLRIQHMSQLTRSIVPGDQIHDAIQDGRCSTVSFGQEVVLIVSRQKPGDKLFRCEIKGRRVP